MPDSETVLVRRELVAVTRRLAALEAKHAEYVEDRRRESAETHSEIDRLRVVEAQHAACAENKLELGRRQGEIDRLKDDLAAALGNKAETAAAARGGGGGRDAAVAERSAAPEPAAPEPAAPEPAAPEPAAPAPEPAGAEKGAACAGCGELAAKLKKAEKRINSCDSYNKPDAERYNADRAKFRREHGTYDSDRKPRKKMGPPVGHKGVSHSRKSEETRYYPLSACEYCGLDEHLHAERPRNKLYVELGADGKIRVSCISAGRAWCARCWKISTAKSESIPGTHMGIELLGSAVACIAKALSYASVAELVEELYGCKFAPTTVINAHEAAANVLEPGDRRVADHIRDSDGWGQADETPFKVNGNQGYAWLVCCGDAVRVGFLGSRAAAVLDLYFPEVKGKPMVTDGYSGYNGIDVRQICLIHLLRRAESFAIRSAGGERGELHLLLYLRLRAMYRRISRIDTADEAAIRELERQVLEIAGGYGEKHAMRTALASAPPYMFTFLRHPGMPCHNNRVEQATHEGPAREKRHRRQLRSAAGMRRLSITCTVFQTCRRLGISPSAALKALRADPEWDMFAHPATGPPRAPAVAAPSRPRAGPVPAPGGARPGPGRGPSRPRAGPVPAPGGARPGPGRGPSRPRAGPVPAPGGARPGPGRGPSRPRAGPVPAPGGARPGPGRGPSRPRAGPVPAPGGARPGPGRGPSRPRAGPVPAPGGARPGPGRGPSRPRAGPVPAPGGARPGPGRGPSRPRAGPVPAPGGARPGPGRGPSRPRAGPVPAPGGARPGPGRGPSRPRAGPVPAPGGARPGPGRGPSRPRAGPVPAPGGARPGPGRGPSRPRAGPVPAPGGARPGPGRGPSRPRAGPVPAPGGARPGPGRGPSRPRAGPVPAPGGARPGPGRGPSRPRAGPVPAPGGARPGPGRGPSRPRAGPVPAPGGARPGPGRGPVPAPGGARPGPGRGPSRPRAGPVPAPGGARPGPGRGPSRPRAGPVPAPGGARPGPGRGPSRPRAGPVPAPGGARPGPGSGAMPRRLGGGGSRGGGLAGAGPAAAARGSFRARPASGRESTH